MTKSLRTVRDFFRFAVTSFERAGLSYGHGAANAIDEAAFIVLEALSLPIDDINPWLDARLEKEERKRLGNLIATRVETRKPAAYLLNKAYIGGAPFFVDERVIVPRSYLGEFLSGGSPFFPSADATQTVLDLCTGSGCLAILAALAYPEAQIRAADISDEALQVAALNIARYQLGDRVSLARGDLFAPVKGERFDLILANPPYVADAEIAAFPPEHQAEPRIAHGGGVDGFEIVRRILKDAQAHLNEGGVLICEFGTGRELLEAEFPHLPFVWADSEMNEGEVFCLSREDFGQDAPIRRREAGGRRPHPLFRR